MGYSIKYSNSNVAKTRRRGKVVIGTDSDGYEKTATSGLYTGVPPVEGKHNLVRVYSSTDPDFYVLDDTEIVNLANEIGGNVTTVLEAKNYLLDRDDIIFTDDIKNDNKVTDNLVLSLDSRIESSFLDNQSTSNLVTNPTFEGTPKTQTSAISDNWSFSGYTGATGFKFYDADTSPIPLKFKDEGAVITTGNNDSTNRRVYFNGSVEPDTTYTLSYWLYSSDHGSISNYFFTYGTGGTHLNSDTYVFAESFTTGKWVFIEQSYTTPSATDNTRATNWGPVISRTTDSLFAIQRFQIEAKSKATGFSNGSRSQNTEWKDLSGNENDATLTNGPTFDSTTNAIKLDGTNDYIASSYYTSADFSDNQSWTINALVNVVSSASAGNSRGGILVNQRYQSEPDPGGFGLNIYNKNYVINLTSGSTNNATSYQNLATSAINYNKIEYITALWDESANSAKIYRNGELVNSSTNSSYGWSSRSTGLTQRIGTSTQGGWQYYFPMDFYNVSLYNKALTESEILQNYHGGDIVTNGLLYAADPGNLVSYQDGNTEILSLTGSLTSSINNGPYYSGSFGGHLNFDGTNEHILTPTISNFQSISLWVNYKRRSTGTSWQYLLDARNSMANSWFVPSNNSYGSNWNSQIYINGKPGTISDVPYNEWCHIYLEANNQYSAPIHFMTRYTKGEGASGSLANVYVYDRGLDEAEILQNYNAHKARFT